MRAQLLAFFDQALFALPQHKDDVADVFGRETRLLDVDAPSTNKDSDNKKTGKPFGFTGFFIRCNLL